MNSFVFNAKIVANAKQFQVCGFEPQNTVRIRVREKPIHGKANTEIERELSKKLNTRVTIVKGLHSNKKTIQVDLEKETALERLKTVSSN